MSEATHPEKLRPLRLFVLDEDRNVVELPGGTEDFDEWCDWMAVHNLWRNVGDTRIGDTQDAVVVTTLFLGCEAADVPADNPPRLFQTAIFGGPHSNTSTFTATWDEARDTHSRVVLEEGRGWLDRLGVRTRA